MNWFKFAAVVVVLVAAIAAARAAGLAGEGFEVSQRARDVSSQAAEFFARQGTSAPYTEFRAAVAGTDPVEFSDARRLFAEGALTPEAVEATYH